MPPHRLGEDVELLTDERDGRRQRVHHFDPRLKRMTTLDGEADGRLWYHAKGAPLELLERCSTVRGRGADRILSRADRDVIRAAFEGYAQRGLRILGFAERHIDRDAPVPREQAESGLCFLGLAALEDPPRPDVAEAVVCCQEAGIRIIVITGDHALTAEAIAREVGIVTAHPRILSGAEIDRLGEEALEDLLGEARELIIARSSPETKLHVVDALRAGGHTVAMTDDGVNDAPALRRADIGVAMGVTGTEVAREAATMVLTDDNFASIVAAVEEGRVVYENIRKFVTYIFAHATPEVVPFLIYALAGGAIPLPLTALQILAIDLGTETLPALALGREPAEPGIMRRPPRRREQRILDRAMLTRAWAWLGLLEAALVMAAFFLAANARRLVARRSNRHRHQAAPRVPAGDHNHLRRHHRLPGRHRIRHPDQPRGAQNDRCALQPPAAVGDPVRADVCGSRRLPASASVGVRDCLAERG